MDSEADHSGGDSIPPVTLAFHKISNHLSFGVSNYSPHRVMRLLEFLSSKSVKCESALITFDDGYAHLSEFLPRLLDHFPIKALVLMPTAFIGSDNRWDYSYRLRKEKHLSAEQIKSLMKRGVRFGTHGHTHRDLTRLKPEIVDEELRSSKRVLEEITKQPVVDISYPFGRYNELVLHASESAGYKQGYSMQFPSDANGPLTRGRYPVYSFDSPRMVLTKLRLSKGRGILSACSRTVGFLSRGTDILNRVLHVGS